MTDLSNAVCTDFTGKEWNRLSRKERKVILANTEPAVRQAWINDQLSFKWTVGRVFLILGILFMLAISIPGLFIEYQRVYNTAEYCADNAFATDSICRGVTPAYSPQQKAEFQAMRDHDAAEDAKIAADKAAEGGKTVSY
jgi:hypothetical protein